MLLRLAVVVAIVTVAPSRVTQAQTVPLFTLEIAGGSGRTSARSAETWYHRTNASMFRASGAVRIGGAGATRPVVVLEHSFDVRGDEVSICVMAPNGTCRAYFPRTSGPSLGVGLRRALGQRWLIGVVVGLSSYGSQAQFAAADVAWKLVKHVGVMSEFRSVRLRAEGEHVSFRPLTFGLRASW
jgi:hypothetical protein